MLRSAPQERISKHGDRRRGLGSSDAVLFSVCSKAAGARAIVRAEATRLSLSPNPHLP
jgi:hypothetical protein